MVDKTENDLSPRQRALAGEFVKEGHSMDDAIRMASGTCDVAQGWQDISTAPKDGTEIIGMFHRRYDETSPPTIYGPWTIAFDGRKWRSSWDGSEVIEYMSDFGTEYKGPDIEPTHWLPLPDSSTLPSTQSTPEEDCSCVGAVIGSHDSSCPYAVTSTPRATPSEA